MLKLELISNSNVYKDLSKTYCNALVPLVVPHCTLVGHF